MEASVKDVVPSDSPHYVPRYIVKDENGRNVATDDPSDGEVLADLRPE